MMMLLLRIPSEPLKLKLLKDQHVYLFSGPSNASPSSSVSGPNVEGEISENLDSANKKTPGPELVSENISETTICSKCHLLKEDIPDIPTQDQQPSAQSTNGPVHQEGIPNDQPHRVTKWTRRHPQSQII